MENKCEHLFQSKIREKQEVYSRSELNDGYKYITLNQSDLYIYCIHCGEHKKISDDFTINK